MDKAIIIGRYDGVDKDDFYREEHDTVRVRTEYGQMWVPLANQPGMKQAEFDPESERVIVFIMNPDYIIGSASDDISTDNVFGMVVQLPPQHRVEKMEERKGRDTGPESNAPTKILGGSSSYSRRRYEMGTPEAKVIVTDDKVLLKGPGGQISICEDAIVTKGKEVKMSFFNESRAGLMKQNWLSQILPESVKVAMEMFTGNIMAPYLPDVTILQRIAGIAGEVRAVIS